MITTRIKWHGDIISAKFDNALNEGLFESAHELLKRAGDSVPHDAGVLEASGTVRADAHPDSQSIFNAAEGLVSQENAYPQVGARKVVYVSYNTPYAIRVHEDPAMQFQGKGRHKFLEATSEAMRSQIAAFMAAKLRAVR